MTRACAVLALLCCAAGPLGAQEGYRLTIQEGTDLRLGVRAGGGEVRGRALGVVGDTLLVRAGREALVQRFPLAELYRLELRGGKNHRRGVAIGASIAGAVTLVAGGIDVSRNASAAPDDRISAGEVVAAAALNAAIGGLVGYALAPGGWERLPLPRR